ncbi:MAG: cupin domain-containing protein [Symploca sp. SIO1C4]|uniref:Cupin domain-containing protein n=1 Tax=Symploca sp. SIO1C4 TaxID=2607765 RepID=A0A6B3NKC4_9CYAN|nr:cupin domain-containing protein [Symploca sp. SIO1C4]
MQQCLKRRMIGFVSVILGTVLGVLLFLGKPVFAQVESPTSATPTPEALVTVADNSVVCPYSDSLYCILPNTAYKVDRTSDSTECDGETARVKFTFRDNKFPGGKFEEIYPIQDGWDLFFNTPGVPGVFEDLSDCGLMPEPNNKLALLSGFKSQDEANTNKSGHFVVAKEYYAINNYAPPRLLGSLTAIGGTEFPILSGAAIGELIIKPNAIRAPHWHLKFAEAGYCYEGLGQVGVIVPASTIPKGEEGGFFSEKRVEEFFVQPREVFLFPEASQHYLRNVGNNDFKCVLFFAEGPPLNPDSLLTITLQNVVGNTPEGVLGPILVTDREKTPMSPLPYTAEQVSKSPAQTYTSVNQGPKIYPVVETCEGVDPDPDDPGCPRASKQKPEGLDRSIYSTLEP